jgi:hypothetical protein
LRLAEILAPHALTTHFKNYRFIRTAEGLGLQNGGLGEGEIDLAAIAGILARYNPDINLNIEVHSQFAPFKLNILSPSYWATHVAAPADGLAWYLAKAWQKPMLEPWPVNLPDGPAAWQREAEDVRASIGWARCELAQYLTA